MEKKISIPLDRLYNFLYDFCKYNDIIIYRFFPHGSKKLEDLTHLNCTTMTWLERMTIPALIFHDQEPLNYNLYTEQEFRNFLDCRPNWSPTDVSTDLLVSTHLRACITNSFGAYDQVLLCHSEQNSIDLDYYTQNGFIGVYYWSHAIIARDWYRFAKIDPALCINFENISYDFLIYNRAWSGTREYRLTLAQMLADNNLISCCDMAFCDVDNQLNYTQHIFVNKTLAISRYDLHELYKVNVHDATASADYSNKDYAAAGIEVVLETLFDEKRHHLTEKTLRPIACGRPFVLAATPGSLQYLKKYGFETFNGLIDETYDSIQDSQQRLTAIIQEMKRISKLSRHEKTLLWEKLYAIAKRNQTLFFSDEWAETIVKEFKNNFDLAITQLTATGKYRNELRRLASNNPALALTLAQLADRDPHGPTTESRKQLDCWIKEKNPSDS